MAITEKQVRHIADLSKLEFKPEEITDFIDQMNGIIDMMGQLESVDTTDVPLTTHGLELENVMREDVAVEGPEHELLFRNVKHSDHGMIQVPAILDSEVEGA